MKERGILMCGEMVRATLDGRKWQTRRLVNPQPIFSAASGDSFEWHGGKALVKAGYGAPYVHSNWEAVEQAMLKVSPYVVGQRLWVKETFFWCNGSESAVYRADGIELKDCVGTTNPERLKWKPSIFMPRRASRITLEVTAVRVERLQDITEDDAKAEGCSPVVHPDGTVDCGTRKTSYANLWDSINGKKHPWASNPFVWVVEFKRITQATSCLQRTAADGKLPLA